MPKLYFLDTGIRNILLDNFDFPEFRMDKGIYWENLVFKLLHDREDLKSINFWRTQDKNEMDFIINKTLALEVKFNGDKFFMSRYKQFIKSYPGIPFRAASFVNPKPDHLTFFDLV
jgi:predicted AAA+ superfamily ATPase